MRAFAVEARGRLAATPRRQLDNLVAERRFPVSSGSATAADAGRWACHSTAPQYELGQLDPRPHGARQLHGHGIRAPESQRVPEPPIELFPFNYHV